jgi:hypothetical protein
MSTYVLVHGAWHGAWCWHRIIARLEAAGHRVYAPDLAGLGRDQTPLNEVTLSRWADDITACIDAAATPVILVGHSRGGLILSEVAERRPDQIRCLVYLTAFLLPAGGTLNQVAATDTASQVGPNLVLSADALSVTVREEALADVFYNDCSTEDIALARTCLRAEPLAPLHTPLQITDAHFGRVPRVYIECLRDRAITIASQRAMQAALPCQTVHVLDSDHSPFFSAPDALAAILQTV